MFLLDILQLHLKCFRDVSLFDVGQQFPLSRWSAEWRSLFNTLETENLLGIECTATCVLIQKVNILHPNVGSRVLAGEGLDEEP